MIQAVKIIGKATSIGWRNPLLASGMADNAGPAAASVSKAATACSTSPRQRGIQRACRAPTQNAPAPSRAQTQEVQLTSSASGTASVTNPMPMASRHSFSRRISGRPLRMVTAVTAI